MREYYKKAFFIVWIILSMIIGLILISPFVLSRSDLENIAPKCEWKAKYGMECFFCGMTNGFIDISKGRFEDATKRNKFSIYLYVIFIMNEAIAFIVLIRFKLVKKRVKNKNH